jgi:uncharacterized protein (DUF849 family)
MAKSNGELIAAAAKLTRMLGQEVATIAEAREIMKIPLR